MERAAKIKKSVSSRIEGKFPPHLSKLCEGDILVISDFPKTHEYTGFERFLKGAKFTAEFCMSFFIEQGNLGGIPTSKLSEHGKEIARSNGYSGDFSDWPEKIMVYPDMVVAEKKNQEEVSSIKWSISVKKHDPKIIKEMIEKVDKDRFSAICRIGANGPTKQENIDKMLAAWADSKYEFYLAFGKKLSIDKEISFKCDASEISGMLSELCSKYPVYSLYINYFLSCDRNCFAKNIVPNSDSLSMLLGCSIKSSVKKGEALSKYFARLFEDNTFNMSLSEVLQARETKGRVVISIDPYDYLTCSVNKHNWTSCHSVFDGSYRSGVMSYMTDQATLVSFRENGKVYEYVNSRSAKNSFSGNSKSWRQNIYVDKETCALVFSREYPYSEKIEGARAASRELIEDALSGYLGFENLWDNYESADPVADFGKKIYRTASQYHYDDVIHKPTNTKLVTLAPADTSTEDIDIVTGGVLYCLHCGKKMANKTGNKFVCDDCSSERKSSDGDF